MTNENPMQELLQELSKLLIGKNIKLVTVESCTGGLVGKIITDQAGSSGWYESGFITYSNEAKHKLVGVDTQLLESFGAVSEQVASAMAFGACKLFPNCISLSITGIAGPGGGSDEKPVGLVYLSVCYSGHSKTVKCLFDGSRDAVRQSALQKGLDLLNDFLTNLNHV
ncbi:MAG: damage-inducible protein CinA [Gammaproteobacteria bacterium]|nr:MAG: damage-inducible protein CinA [Gammaproteobacteria bacterium]